MLKLFWVLSLFPYLNSVFCCQIRRHQTYKIPIWLRQVVAVVRSEIMRSVYLDNNATTPVDPRVVESMTPYFLDFYGNASSIHQHGQKARAALEEARHQVAKLVGARPRDIVFTSGGTEADNMALRGVAQALADRGRHIITSTIEHPAVLKTCEQLEREGFQVSYLGVDREGLLDPQKVAEAIREDTILISVMHANNEVGSIQDIREMASIARDNGVVFHTDAVQTVGKLRMSVEDLGVDLLSMSSHKLHGPKGIGALYVRQGTPLSPQLLGGSHERSRRAGTENVPGIIGFGKACAIAGEALPDFQKRVEALRDKLETELTNRIPDVQVNGTRDSRMPHVTNLSFLSVEGEALLIALDFQGIAVSTGAACSSGALETSHVLRAMKLDTHRTQGAIRFSLSRMISAEDIDYVIEVLPPVVERMREMAVRR